MSTSSVEMVFLALAFTLAIVIIRARAGQVILTATGNGRITVYDRQVLQLKL